VQQENNTTDEHAELNVQHEMNVETEPPEHETVHVDTDVVSAAQLFKMSLMNNLYILILFLGILQQMKNNLYKQMRRNKGPWLRLHPR